jgi:hypothetical protein
VVVLATNSNAFAVHIGTLALLTTQGAGGFTVANGATSCALSFASQTNGGAGWTVPASGSLSITLSGALGMGLSADNSCQNQAVSVYLAADR